MLEAQDEYGEDAFSAGIGAEAIRSMLETSTSSESVRFGELRETNSRLKPQEDSSSA